MFNNIGSKLKGLAHFLCWGGIVFSVIFGFASIENGGLILLVFGSLFSWIGSWAVYGLGQAVENTDKLVAALKNDEVPEEPIAKPVIIADPKNWNCPNCGQEQDESALYCAHCSTTRDGKKYNHNADWKCFNCGTVNAGASKFCSGCKVSKVWSEKKHHGL